VSGLLRAREYLRAPGALKRRYDVVIIGGGAHGMAAAYYLATKHGVTDVLVLERSYVGAGGSGRNTTVLRANYKAPEAIEFFATSLEAYRELGRELGYNLLHSERGMFWLAHNPDSVRVQRERALLNAAKGVDTVFLDPDEVKKLCPAIDLTCGGHGYPVLGASYHPPAAVIRHDAVVWGYAAAAMLRGVDVHEHTPVTHVLVEDGRCTGVVTPAARVEAGTVICAVGGFVSHVAAMAGLELPIVTHPLQAFVTEPYDPVIDQIVGSVDLLCYVSQTSRGELLVGAEIERYASYSTRSTFSFMAEAAARSIDLLPCLARMPVLRQWTGLCDMTPDSSPIMGETGIENFYLDGGWGTWGFKAVPAAGQNMAELVATKRVPEAIAPFRLSRFYEDRSVPDRGSAGTH
jgi:sarcosine oxidase subunit beta